MLVSTHTDPGSGFSLYREGVNAVGWLEISGTIKRKDKTSRVKDKKIRLRILEGKDNCLTVVTLASSVIMFTFKAFISILLLKM